MEKLLRQSWNSSIFLRGNADPSRPILLADDGSKAHLERLNSLMTSDFDWVLIRLISLLSQQAELIGSWCEGCPCHSHCHSSRSGSYNAPFIDDGSGIVSIPLTDETTQPSRKRAKRRSPAEMKAHKDAQRCSFKCCRAPELAAGHALEMQRELAASHRTQVTEVISKIANNEHRGELISCWSSASSKLYGYLDEIDLMAYVICNCHFINGLFMAR